MPAPVDDASNPRPRRLATEGPGPIFIVGVPRSGTTLLRVLLNRHPNIAICDETYFFFWVYARRRAFGSLELEANRRRLVDAYLDTWRVTRLGLDREWLAELLVREGTSYPALFASLLRAYARSRDKRRAGEKTPQHAEHALTLREWYPDASIVHVVRDPRDVVASLHRMPWGFASTSANAKLWVRLVSRARRIEGLSGCSALRYEDLVESPETALRSLCEVLGEPFEGGMLSDGQAETPDRPWFERAYKPVSRSRVGIWTKDLSERQARIVEWLADPLMAEYGYEPRLPAASPSLKASALLHEGAETCRRKAARLPRLWHRWVAPRDLSGDEARIDGRRRDRAASVR